MASHLGRNIRCYVGGNGFSAPFSPLSGARPFTGARSLSTSSLPSSPNQAPKQVKSLQEFFTVPLIAGLVFTLSEGMDCGGNRSGYELVKADLKRKTGKLAEADLEAMQRRIDGRKSSGRVIKKDSVA